MQAAKCPQKRGSEWHQNSVSNSSVSAFFDIAYEKSNDGLCQTSLDSGLINKKKVESIASVMITI
jgi:hypothetical protein